MGEAHGRRRGIWSCRARQPTPRRRLLARDPRPLRQAGPSAQRVRRRHVGRRLPRADGGDVRGVGCLAPARPGARRSRRPGSWCGRSSSFTTAPTAPFCRGGVRTTGWASPAGLLVYSPFHVWRHEHAVHHASAGDLDRRGRGDVETLTVAEWVALSRRKRLAYRTFRNPLVMLGLGPIWALMIAPRLVPGWARARFGRTIIATNIALAVLLVGLCALVGWRAVLVVQLPTAMLAGAIGIWMFYVQHQFEDVYWERKEDWSYAEAALRGSSYLKLPRRPSVLHRQHRPAPRPPPQRPHPQLQPPARPRREPGLPRRAPTELLGRRPRPTAQALRRGPRPHGHLPRGAPRARHRRDQRPAASSRASVLSRASAVIAGRRSSE